MNETLEVWLGYHSQIEMGQDYVAWLETYLKTAGGISSFL